MNAACGLPAVETGMTAPCGTCWRGATPDRGRYFPPIKGGGGWQPGNARPGARSEWFRCPALVPFLICSASVQALPTGEPADTGGMRGQPARIGAQHRADGPQTDATRRGPGLLATGGAGRRWCRAAKHPIRRLPLPRRYPATFAPPAERGQPLEKTGGPDTI